MRYHVEPLRFATELPSFPLAPRPAYALHQSPLYYYIFLFFFNEGSKHSCLYIVLLRLKYIYHAIRKKEIIFSLDSSSFFTSAF